MTALTKLATKKAAGVLGDDLALCARQVSGVSTDRKLPVVRAVAKGSECNNLILVPAALAISAPLRMLGGAFLCYEGFAGQRPAVATAMDYSASPPRRP